MVLLALVGIVPVALVLFAMIPPRRAVVATVLGGWLFLPMGGYALPGLPDFNKTSATALALWLGILLFDSARLGRYRFRLIDLPVLGWCLAAGASVIVNEIGGGGLTTLITAAKLVFSHFLGYGLFWLAGRIYFTKLEDLTDAAIGFVIAGLVYVPLCFVEMMLSPQLHNWVYGFHQHAFGQTIRLGGYRPMVFMQHGLMLGLFMVNAALVALWLWQARTVRTLFEVPMALVVGVLFATAVLCRSSGALALMLLGLGFLFATRWLNLKLVMVAMLAVAPVYIAARASQTWTGDNLVQVAVQINEERGKSFGERIYNENLYVDKAQTSLMLGRAGWNRWQVRDPKNGKIITVPDGMWVIALGRYGLVGMVSFFLIYLLPMFLLVRSIGPPRNWWKPEVAPAAALAMMLTLFAIDCLLNAMISDFYTLTAGAVAGVLPLRRVARRNVPTQATIPSPARVATIQG